jgi:hypothetical protein
VVGARLGARLLGTQPWRGAHGCRYRRRFDRTAGWQHPVPQAGRDSASSPGRAEPARDPLTPFDDIARYYYSAWIIRPDRRCRRLRLSPCTVRIDDDVKRPGTMATYTKRAIPGARLLSGLPYFYLRGSPPSDTLYVYDDIPVPTLYHRAIGPAVSTPAWSGASRSTRVVLRPGMDARQEVLSRPTGRVLAPVRWTLSCGCSTYLWRGRRRHDGRCSAVRLPRARTLADQPPTSASHTGTTSCSLGDRAR